MDDYTDFELEDDSEDFDSFDDFDDFEDERGPEGESDNRTFWLVAGILGAILVLALVCMVVYAMVIVPGQRNEQATAAAAIHTQNASGMLTAESEAQAALWTPTPTISATPEPVTSTPTNTPVVAEPGEGDDSATPIGPTVTQDPRTATVSALLTKQAGSGITPTPTALPDGGFADDVGIPGMLALAAALVVIIFLARRLRTAT